MSEVNTELISIPLGANSKTPNSCRIHDGSFHVNYIVEEKENDFGDEIQVEKRNVTHKSTVVDDSVLETGWMLEIDGEKAHLMASEHEEFGVDINQHLSAQTCFQLADMFLRAGETLLQQAAVKKAQEADIQRIIDSSKLSFESIEEGRD